MDRPMLNAESPRAAAEPPSPVIESASPPRGWWRRLRSAIAGSGDYDRRFAENTSENLFRGVFDSAEAALRSAPATRPIGYDNPASAALYFGRMRHEQYDYPAMFWMQQALQAGMRSIFDVGGHIGIKFYAFAEPLALPDDARWLVCDVPAVVERGAIVAARRGVDARLSFTSCYEALDGRDLLFASGALQYLPMTLPQWLDTIARPPRRIIINTTPIHPQFDFHTLNGIGTAYCPYHVFAEAPFLEGLAQRGYVLRDRWINPDKRLTLPGDPAHGLDHYSGFCLDLVVG
ncbi:MAG: methyltransferase, TIGR04325 family [Burkholderiaceae bacterium]